MKRIQIITDSTSDITPILAKEHGITVVPLTVNFTDESFLDGVEITPDEFFAKLIKAEKLPTTSQVSVGSFVKAYKSFVGKTDVIISIHISEKMSGTYQAAVMAAEEVPELEIIPIDSKTVSYALGHLAMNASTAAQEGADVEDVLIKIKQSRETQEVYFAAGTLEYLVKGGRIGKAQGMVGSLLNIKPFLTIDDEGFVAPLEKIRGSKKAIVRLEEAITGYIAKHGPSCRKTIMHSACYKKAEDFQNMLAEKYGIVDSDIGAVGPVVGTHLGPETLGLVLTVR